MNRKIALSGLSIVTALVMLGGAAFAAFTAQATATGNTFSTTNPNLLINVNNAGEGNPVTGASVTGLIPGVAGPVQTFVLHNTDTDAGADLPVTMQLVVNAGNTLPGSDLDITVNCGAGDITHTYADWISTGFSIGTVTAGNTLSCSMTPTLHAGVSNGDAGTSAKFDAVFTGTLGS
ncbi:MAG TPA: hypothetical protein VG965_03455 [Patescibacteria group bacterium]|nr:hypothetical protein [Patescibacteria group bacterium]